MTGNPGRTAGTDPSDALYRRNRRLSWTSAGILLLAVALFALDALILSTDGFGRAARPLPIHLELGPLPDLQLPSGLVLVAAALLWAAFSAGVVAIEVAFASQILAAKRRRMPVHLLTAAARTPFVEPPPAAAVPAPLDVSTPVDTLRITVLVPAHDEATTIGATIDSLRAQDRPPERIVVVADNCTDDTAAIARARGAEVRTTVENRARKAGALNQVLRDVLPSLGAEDVVLVMDADTVLVSDFLAVAERRLLADPVLQAVGGIFCGEPGSGLVGQLQRNEYTRYSRTIARRKGRRVMVLTGTGSVFRARTLQAVAASRGSLVPGTPGDVYDAVALTEDNELTLAVKTLGAKLVSPRECQTVTEVMPTVPHLWRQRIRWDRGALENLATYGLTFSTTRYWLQQVGLAYATLALNLYFLLVVVTVLATGELLLGVTFWVVVTIIFVVERTWTVWPAGWRARLVALPLLIELVYTELILAVFVRGLLDIVLRRRPEWGHVDRAQLAHQGALALPVVAVVGAWLADPVLGPATLHDTWFQALATVVAVNTVVFAFLALLNLVPRRQA